MIANENTPATGKTTAPAVVATKTPTKVVEATVTPVYVAGTRKECEYDPTVSELQNGASEKATANHFRTGSEAASCYYAPECARMRDSIKGGSVNPDCLLYADSKAKKDHVFNTGQNKKANKLKSKVIQVAYPLSVSTGTSNQENPSSVKEIGTKTFKQYQPEITTLKDYSKSGAIVKEALDNIDKAVKASIDPCSIAQNQRGFSEFTVGDKKCGRGCSTLTAAECKNAAKGGYCEYKSLTNCTQHLDNGVKTACGGKGQDECDTNQCVTYQNGTTTVLDMADPKIGKILCYDTKGDAKAQTNATACGATTLFRTVQTKPTDFDVQQLEGKEWKIIDMIPVQTDGSGGNTGVCVFGSVDAHRGAIKACKCLNAQEEGIDDKGDKLKPRYREMKNIAMDFYNVTAAVYDQKETQFAKKVQKPTFDVKTVEKTRVTEADVKKNMAALAGTTPAALRRKGYSI